MGCPKSHTEEEKDPDGTTTFEVFEMACSLSFDVLDNISLFFSMLAQFEEYAVRQQYRALQLDFYSVTTASARTDQLVPPALLTDIGFVPQGEPFSKFKGTPFKSPHPVLRGKDRVEVYLLESDSAQRIHQLAQRLDGVEESEVLKQMENHELIAVTIVYDVNEQPLTLCTFRRANTEHARYLQMFCKVPLDRVVYFDVVVRYNDDDDYYKDCVEVSLRRFEEAVDADQIIIDQGKNDAPRFMSVVQRMGYEPGGAPFILDISEEKEPKRARRTAGRRIPVDPRVEFITTSGRRDLELKRDEKGQPELVLHLGDDNDPKTSARIPIPWDVSIDDNVTHQLQRPLVHDYLDQDTASLVMGYSKPNYHVKLYTPNSYPALREQLQAATGGLEHTTYTFDDRPDVVVVLFDDQNDVPLMYVHGAARTLFGSSCLLVLTPQLSDKIDIPTSYGLMPGLFARLEQYCMDKNISTLGPVTSSYRRGVSSNSEPINPQVFRDMGMRSTSYGYVKTIEEEEEEYKEQGEKRARTAGRSTSYDDLLPIAIQTMEAQTSSTVHGAAWRMTLTLAEKLLGKNAD